MIIVRDENNKIKGTMGVLIRKTPLLVHQLCMLEEALFVI